MTHSFNKVSRDDILSAMGLQRRSTTADMVLPALGLFGVGLVVGAGLGLLFAPKSGAQTRDVIGSGIGDVASRITSRIRRTRDPMRVGEELGGESVEVIPRASTSSTGRTPEPPGNGVGTSAT